ncbi:unnamed protein product [Discosporangium mesarthrocarpum]
MMERNTSIFLCLPTGCCKRPRQQCARCCECRPARDEGNRVQMSETWDPSQKIPETRLSPQSVWTCLCQTLGVGETVSQRWWDVIEGHYRESSRYYHTLKHVEDMLEDLDRLEGLSRPDLVQLSIFFHDLIYEARSGTNEEDSAKMFEMFADEAGLDPSNVATVLAYIIATKKHDVLGSDDHDLRAFIDLDMAVIGREHDAYMTYAQQIRAEYAHVPHTVYCHKRAEVLRAFLKQPKIYATKSFQISLEARARSNVATEISLLNKGVVPGQPPAVARCSDER